MAENRRQSFNQTDINVNGSGDNKILDAAGSGTEILVHGVIVHVDGASTVKLVDGGDNDLTGAMDVDDGQEVRLPFSEVPWGKTAANKQLDLNLGSAVSADGVIIWSEAT